MPDFKTLGQSLPRVDAMQKVTGKATYAADVYLPEMLMCKLLTGTVGRARIVKLDTSKALALPGVRAVITGQDFPDVLFGSGALKDRRIMARDEVFYVGDPVAAVAADDEVTAQEAVALIQVDYQPLDTVVNPLDAIHDGSPTVHLDMPSFDGYGFAMGGNNCTLLDADRGDVDQAFRQADHVFEENYQSQPINQGFLEPMACVANHEPNGRLTVWASTQGPFQVRAQLASVLDIPISKIKVVAMELGGGFGAKLRLAFEAFPALLALKTGKPVKLVNTREEAFTLNGPRLETNIHLKTGVMQDGTIVARESYSIFDVGACLGAGPNSGVAHALGPYNTPNLRLRSYGVYTNKIYVGSYRASGVADMTFAVESHMDSMAHQLGLDPIEFRLRNTLSEGDTNISGAKVPSNGLKETVEAVKQRLGLPKKLGENRGVGIALGEWRSGSGPSTASISVNEDGTVSLLTGPSGGSRIVYSQGKAVQRAAEDARQKLFDLAAQRLGVPSDALVCRDGQVYVQDNPAQSMSLDQLARASLTSQQGPIIGLASLSNMPYAPVYNTQAAEVLVDTETGQVKVTRFVQAQDVGVAINPMAVVGQLEGGRGAGNRPGFERGDSHRPRHGTGDESLPGHLPDAPGGGHAGHRNHLDQHSLGGRSLRRQGGGGTAGIWASGRYRQRNL